MATFFFDDSPVSQVAVRLLILRPHKTPLRWVRVTIAKPEDDNPSNAAKQSLSQRDLELQMSRAGGGLVCVQGLEAVSAPEMIFDTPAILIADDDRLLVGLDEILHFFWTDGPLRLQRQLSLSKRARNVSFYFDFSSPWAFLGFKRLDELRELGCQVTLVPVLLGALFKSIGGALVPMQRYSAARRNHGLNSMQHWAKEAKADLKWPSNFPLRSLLALRVFLASDNDLNVGSKLFSAAWEQDLNIGDENILRRIVGDDLLHRASEFKEELRRNTEHAAKIGCCGAPSYEIEGGYLLWGQDKLDMVKDLVCGWNPPESKSKL